MFVARGLSSALSRRILLGCWAILAGLAAPVARGVCLSPPGDITGEGVTTVVDVQCTILVVLQNLAGSSTAPSCLPGGDITRVDLDCNGSPTVVDIQLTIGLTVQGALPANLDANGDDCADPCQNPCVGLAAGTPCDDGNACTTGDACNAGQCVGSGSLVCQDNNPCTDNNCAPGTGCLFPANSAPCSDGNLCTVNDTCANGGCVGGPPLVCADNNPCTNEFCSPTQGCQGQFNSNSCNDGNVCTTVDVCIAGSCQGVAGATCNDNNPCTTDGCVNPGGCTFTNNSAACNDGNACTVGDFCNQGSCVGAPQSCNDNNPCTTDSCNPASGCVFANNTFACSDGTVCTVNDKCTNGVCQGSAIVCNDGNLCTTDTCNPATGCQFSAPGAGCNDFDPCTTDSCNPVTGACTTTFNSADPQCAPITFAQVQSLVFSGTCAGCHGSTPNDSTSCSAPNCDGGKCLATRCEATQCGTAAKGNAGLEECEPGSGVFLSTAECIYERAVRGIPSAMPPSWSGIVLSEAEKKAISGWWHGIENSAPANWCPPPPVSYSAQIQPIWNKWCTNCHGSAGGLNLAAAVSHQNLVNVNSGCNASVKRVLPGSQANSMLWRKLANSANKCGGAMPSGQGLVAISPGEAALVAQWILEGALKN